MQKLNVMPLIRLSYIGMLLSLPLAASAVDNPLIKGYCGPPPPNSWFQFSSSTYADVKAQLISTLTQHAFADYPAAVAAWFAANGGATHQGSGCQVQLHASAPLPPITSCPDLSSCYVQLNGDTWSTCGSTESTHSLNTFVRNYGGCYFGYATAPKVVVAIDPGHGLNCAAVNEKVGAVGVTDFPPNDPPPGKLQEDQLTVGIALELEKILPTTKYKVVMTKRDVISCPTLKERGFIARKNKAKVFVSIHINRPNPVPFDLFGSGTSALYNSDKPASQALANLMATSVSSNLGVNNRGSFATGEEIGILKPKVTPMHAVLVEAARLSGNDEKILHASGSAAKVASGIKAALDAFLSK